MITAGRSQKNMALRSITYFHTLSNNYLYLSVRITGLFTYIYYLGSPLEDN